MEMYIDTSILRFNHNQKKNNGGWKFSGHFFFLFFLKKKSDSSLSNGCAAPAPTPVLSRSRFAVLAFAVASTPSSSCCAYSSPRCESRATIARDASLQCYRGCRTRRKRRRRRKRNANFAVCRSYDGFISKTPRSRHGNDGRDRSFPITQFPQGSRCAHRGKCTLHYQRPTRWTQSDRHSEPSKRPSGLREARCDGRVRANRY